jgi:hypothetical protein
MRRPLKPLEPINPAAPPRVLPRPTIVPSPLASMAQLPVRLRDTERNQAIREGLRQKAIEFAKNPILPGRKKTNKYPVGLAGGVPIDPDTDEPLVLPDHGPVQGTYEQDEAIPRTAGIGRITEYRASYDRIARNMRLLGYTIEECAEVFGISRELFQGWRRQYPSFSDAWFEGGDYADAKVARALYKRALGYEHEAVKIFNGRDGVVEVPYTERFPPDTAAGTFWLTNRQNTRWRNRSSSELTGAGGAALNPPSVNVMIVPTPNGGMARPPQIDAPAIAIEQGAS